MRRSQPTLGHTCLWITGQLGQEVVRGRYWRPGRNTLFEEVRLGSLHTSLPLPGPLSLSLSLSLSHAHSPTTTSFTSLPPLVHLPATRARAKYLNRAAGSTAHSLPPATDGGRSFSCYRSGQEILHLRFLVSLVFHPRRVVSSLPSS